MIMILILFVIASVNYIETVSGRSPVRCPLFMCRKYCEFGFQQKNGCDICSCKPVPTSCDECTRGGYGWVGGRCISDCSRIADISCYTGKDGCDAWRKDVAKREACDKETTCEGCIRSGENCSWLQETRSCISSQSYAFWVQPRVTTCPDTPGHEFCDGSKQQTCRKKCPEPKCKSGECLMRRDSCCDIVCQKPTECPLFMCRMYCEFGFQQKNGCDICACQPAPTSCDNCIRRGYGWIGQRCVSDCSMIADISCYAGKDGCDRWEEDAAKSKNVWLADGCPSQCGKQDGRFESPSKNAGEVQCCSMDGSSCRRKYRNGKCFTGRHNDKRKVSYLEAKKICSGLGMRVCTRTEVESGVCCSRGCMYDCTLVWTSTPSIRGV